MAAEGARPEISQFCQVLKTGMSSGAKSSTLFVPMTSLANFSARAASSLVRFSPMRTPILSPPELFLISARFFAVSLMAASIPVLSPRTIG